MTPAGLRGLWSRVAQPSLVRRLLLAQMATLGLLWTLTLAGAIWTTRNGDGLLDNKLLFEALVAVAEDLSDHPDRQGHSLKALDRAMRQNFGEGADATELVPTLLVWRGNQLVYRSAGGAPSLLVQPSDQVKRITVDGKRWMARSDSTTGGGLVVTLLVPAAEELALSINSRGLYLMPMVISLPFLVFPAWWSLRVALRPWRQLSENVAARGPRDLQPLSPVPRHRELQPLVQALNDLLARLQASSLRERNLVADAAHELRTPLAALGIGIDALGRYEVPRDLMGNLQRCSQRASRLVGQLLKLMRSEARSGSEPHVVIAMDQLLVDRLAVFDVLAHAKTVELEYDCEAGLLVCGEREGLESLVDNLIDNAIKYSPPGGIVSVRALRYDGSVRFEVSDQGPGIPEQWRERVFDRFFRLPDQSQGGSGLGLAIVQSVVLKHKGLITLLPAICGGLCVRVDIPSLAPSHGAPIDSPCDPVRGDAA